MASDFVSAPASTAAPSKVRKLSAAHFAFMRGLVQGLPIRETWERYLRVEGSSSDMRVVRKTKFSVVRKAGGYEFQISKQEYFGETPGKA